MAYYNGFPATYQPMYQQPVYQAPQSQQAPSAGVQVGNNGIIWVQGEQAAKSYLVAPGSTVQLWDSEEKVIYLKSADASGMPSMKILDYTIRGEAEKKTEETVYATKNDLDALAEKVREIKEEISGMNRRRTRLMKEEGFDE